MEVIRLKGLQLHLGEGVIWDAHRQMIHYVDIEGCCIYSCREDGTVVHQLKTHDVVGCIVLDASHRICYPMPDGLYRYHPESGMVQRLCTWTIPDTLRFNDGKAAPDGALFVGTMYRDQSDPRAKDGGFLYRFTPEAGLVPVRDSMSIPNGLCWSADHRTMYHIDTVTGQVMAYPYDPEASTMGEGVAIVRLKEGEGGPDGMTIDAEGNLWVARWDGYAVTQYSGATGEAMASIPVPDRNVSCCCFGGSDMKTLFITTAMDNEGKGGQVYSIRTETTGSAAHPLRWEREENEP